MTMQKNKPDAQAPANLDGARSLLEKPISVINVGLDAFATELEEQGVHVTRVEWSPPAGGDEKLAALLAKLGM
jgi:FdrA protein